MNTLYIIATAFTVSIDSFIAGFSLSLHKRKSLMLPLTVAFATFVLCLVANLAGTLLKPLLQNYVKYIGALILFALGVANLTKTESYTLQQISFSHCLAIGFGVGLDGAAATFSLIMQGIGDIILTPILFAATHFLAVFAGQWLAQTANAQKTNVFSAVMFFVLALVKLCDL